MFTDFTLQKILMCVFVSGFHYKTYLNVSCGLGEESLLQMVMACHVK